MTEPFKVWGCCESEASHTLIEAESPEHAAELYGSKDALTLHVRDQNGLFYAVDARAHTRISGPHAALASEDQ